MEAATGIIQPLLFGPPPDDPCRCARCEWQGDGADLIQMIDEVGTAAEFCPECGETTILEGHRRTS